MPGNVSWNELSAWMNLESFRCCQFAAEHDDEQAAAASVVPWLEGAKPMTSSTIERVSGQKRSAQRPTMPPWLWPTIAILRPARAYIVRIALTTYSPLT